MGWKALFQGEALSHTFVLAVCLGMLGLGLLLGQPDAEEQRLTLGGVAVPPLCMVKRSFGLDCPGCGLTRSFVAASQGDLGASVGWHRLGPLFVLYVLAQAVRHGLWLGLPGRREAIARWGGLLDRALVVLVVLLPINQVLRWLGI